MNTNHKKAQWLLVVCALVIAQPLWAIPRLSLGAVRGFPAQSVQVPLSFRNDTNQPVNVVALQVDVVFEEESLNSGDPAGGGALRGHSLISSHPATGVRRIVVRSARNVGLTNGFLGTLPFDIAPGVFKNLRLVLTNIVLATASASSLGSSNISGGIAINHVYLRQDGAADGFINVASNQTEQCYVIQASTEFLNWVDISTNSTLGNLVQFIDLDANTFPKRFYRAVLCDSLSGLRIGTVERLADGRIQFDITAQMGRRYVIQGSTNLSQWVDLYTANPAGGTFRFTNTSPPYSAQFFRVKAE